MYRLPQTTNFDPDDYPELSEIFGTIDAGIAAIVAADPAFRPSQPRKRTKPASRLAGATGTSRRAARKAAA